LYADPTKAILAKIGWIAKTQGAPIAEIGWLGLR
jgi:hypothetical protein